MNNAARWFSLIVGGLVLICGISLVFTPMESYLMISFFIPLALLFNGAGSLGNYFADKKTGAASGWTLADGIFGIIFGLLLLLRPVITFVSVPFVLGVWVLLAGAFRIVGAIYARKETKGWLLLLVFGILGVLTGAFLIGHPLFTAVILSYLVAWSFVMTGIRGILFFFIRASFH